MDCVFGSMNGNGETIDRVVETYDEWKRGEDEREERNRRREMEVLSEMNSILEEKRMIVLKQLSSDLLHSEWDFTSAKNYVKKAVGLYHDARNESTENSTIEDGETDNVFTGVVSFLYLLSDLVALFPDAHRREEILKELEVVIGRSLGEGDSSTATTESTGPLELNEEDLEEKFVKGSGAGGQKVNKTSNRVILVHVPTQVRVECQDTRSLQQNRKIARKRLRLKVDEFINGASSKAAQKASAVVTKKAKNKARNKRRREKKKKD